MFRALSRQRQLLRILPKSFTRRQHDVPQPHKTYFQNASQPSSPVPSPSASPLRTRSPILSWVTTSIRTITIGAILGFGASLALITFDYVEDPYENGSEADEELVAEIEEIFADHIPFLQLREDPDFQEIQPYWHLSRDEQKSSMMLGPLNGSRGVIWKMFWNEKLKTITVFVFFGNGVEGWPDVVHGGMLTSVLDEALGRVAANTFPGHAAVNGSLQINYLKPVRPGSIYAIRAQPDDLILDMKHGVATVPDTEERKQRATVLGLLVREGGSNMGSGSQDLIFAEAIGTYVAPEQSPTEGRQD